MDKKHIVKIKGKEFITFAGVLEEAHKQWIEDIRIVELSVDWEKKSAYCIATCGIKEPETEPGKHRKVREFMGVGSGTQDNCGSMVKNHFVEMAQTRAFARCLKYALNLEGTCAEEMTDAVETKPKVIATEKTFNKVMTKEEIDSILTCSKCKADINEKVSDYSIKNFGKALCFSCQKLEKAKDE